LRNYQTLTLIGSIIGILTAVGFWIFASSFESFVTEFGTEETVMQNRQAMSYAAIAVPIVIVLEIVVLVLVFVIKPNQVKPIGIFLLVVSVVVLIGTSWYGILPFALFLPAGILALRYKPKPGEEPEVQYRSDGSPIR
jgi:hypothetical protein